MSEFDTEAIVVGAGAVGLAIGYALAQRGIAPIVIERANLIGSGVSLGLWSCTTLLARRLAAPLLCHPAAGLVVADPRLAISWRLPSLPE